MKSVPWDLVLSLAADLGVKEHARIQWRTRRRVPYRWHTPLLRLAAERRIELHSDQLAPPPHVKEATPSPQEAA